MPSSLDLVNVTRVPICAGERPTELVITYDGKHSDNKTTLHFQAIVRQVPNGFVATIDFGDSFGRDGVTEGSVENALLRLGRWCQRAGEALQEAKPSQVIPF